METVTWRRDRETVFFRWKSSEKYDKEQKEKAISGIILSDITHMQTQELQALIVSRIISITLFYKTFDTLDTTRQ